VTGTSMKRVSGVTWTGQRGSETPRPAQLGLPMIIIERYSLF